MSPGVDLAGALALLFLGVTLWYGAGLVTRRRIVRGTPEDAATTLLGASGLVGRILAALGVLGALRAVLPEATSGTTPFLAAAVAFAIGWSARDLLRDLLAAFLLSTSDEGLVRGARLSGDGWDGTLDRRTFRGLELVGIDGERLIIPWRRLLAEPYRLAERDRRPVHVFEVTLDPSLAEDPRPILREAVAASPAVPAGSVPVILRNPNDPRRYELRVPLVSHRFARRVEAEVRDRLSRRRG